MTQPLQGPTSRPYGPRPGGSAVGHLEARSGGHVGVLQVDAWQDFQQILLIRRNRRRDLDFPTTLRGTGRRARRGKGSGPNGGIRPGLGLEPPADAVWDVSSITRGRIIFMIKVNYVHESAERVRDAAKYTLQD